MKKKITALMLTVCMLLLCACGDNAKTDNVRETDKVSLDDTQYVIALNPSVAFEDGTVSSIRNDAAKAISKDVSAKTSDSLYSDTAWQWLSAQENSEWGLRLVRNATQWISGRGETAKGVPYAYSVNDNGTASLAVFDSTKMAVEGCNDGELPQNGILMSFTGSSQEGICYTATSNCTVTFSDVNGGNAAIVSKIAGINTSFLENESAANAVVLRVLRNNRIYWQGVLDSENTAVEFPYLSDIELTSGDTVIFTAQATDDTDGIETGACDLPATTKTVVKTLKNVTTEQVTEEIKPTEASPKEATVPLMTDGIPTFTIVTPKGIDKTLSSTVSKLRTGMSKALGEDVDTKNDEIDSEGAKLLLYNTKYEASQKALSDIKSGRSANAGDFIIRMSGDDLVIAAGNEYSLQFAVDFFLENYCKDESSEIPANLNYVSSKHNKVHDVTLAGTSIEKYRIVYSHVASFIETSAAEYLRREIVLTTGKIIDCADDSTSASANEILVGNTNRTSLNYATTVDSKALSSNVSATDNYKISVSKGKTVISGDHIYAVNAGAIRLAKLFEEKSSFSTGYTLNGKYDGGYTLTDGYKLTWSDEFNGSKLSNTWISKGTSTVKNHFGGYTILKKSNNKLRDGALVQTIEREGNDITHAHIYSTGSEPMQFRYGYLEIRVKFPLSEGVGCSFWTQGDLASEFLEIDIYETFGDPFNIKSNLHTWGDTHLNLLGGTGSILNESAGVSKPYGYEYHTVGIEWSDDLCTFYVDGKFNVNFDCSSSRYDCFDKAAYLILGGSPCSADYSKKLLADDFKYDEVSYDWIHVYQKENDGSIMYNPKK